jgi:hypothetical protein
MVGIEEVSEYVRITDRKIQLTDEGVEALMSDYVPTTEEVFHCYQYCSIMEDPESAHEAEPQFDRWLAEVKAQAWDEGVAAHRRYDYPENPYRGENK